MDIDPVMNPARKLGTRQRFYRARVLIADRVVPAFIARPDESRVTGGLIV